MSDKKLFEFTKTAAGIQFDASSATQNEYLTAILVLTQNLVANKPQFIDKITLNDVMKMLRANINS